MQESLEKRILVITSKHHKIDFSLFFLIMFLISAIKAHVPGLEFIFELSITYPSQSHLSKL